MPQIKDLLEDPEFIRWVKHPDGDLNHYWEHWIAANPNRIGDVKLAKQILLNLKFPAKTPSVDTKREVLNKLLKDSRTYSSVNKTPPIPRPVLWVRLHQVSRVAAVLILSFMTAFLFYSLFPNDHIEIEDQNLQWITITKETNFGEKLNFRLPDGSMVWLNAGSSLQYPSAFDSTVRMVRLEGEGFFEVAEDTGKPFKVQSESLTITAIGTSFNVNSQDKRDLRVSLVTGKVMVDEASTGKEYFLTPGQELGYNSEDRNADIHPFDLELVQSWRNGILMFRKAPFAQVKDELERWYGVSIKSSGDHSSSWRFTGKFENQTLETVLTSMSNIEEFNYEINDKEVIISF
jgi:ferric-dicitrate binding protein FerR (iron transport regulator)